MLRTRGHCQAAILKEGGNGAEIPKTGFSWVWSGTCKGPEATIMEWTFSKCSKCLFTGTFNQRWMKTESRYFVEEWTG